jgi:hypothetical protein
VTDPSRARVRPSGSSPLTQALPGFERALAQRVKAVIHLDDWARRHAEPTDPNHTHPPPGLGRATDHPARRRAVRDAPGPRPDLELSRRRSYRGRDAVHPTELRLYHERKARLLAYLAQVDPDLEGIGAARLRRPSSRRGTASDRVCSRRNMPVS